MNAAPIALIVAHDHNFLIGRNGDLPWRLPNDLKHFKALTLGQTVLMGRKTWESLPRKPLPGRSNRVLTRDRSFKAEGAEVFHDLEAALAAPAEGSLLVIGGAELYALTLPRAQRLHITLVDAHETGDTYFPTYNLLDYRETARIDHAKDAAHDFAYRFLTLDRQQEQHHGGTR